MKVIIPSKIELINSNIPEADYPEWDSSTTYNENDVVIVKNLNPNGITKAFKALSDNNTGNYPPDNPDKWQDLGATNRWKMFDNFTSTQSENKETIEVNIKGYRTNYLILYNIDAYYVTITWKLKESDNSIIQQSKTLYLNEDTIKSWGEYFFTGFSFKSNSIFQLPYTFGEIEVSIKLEKGNNVVKCGHVIMGKAEYIGCTLFGINAGILDFSKKETDQFGITYLKQGNYAKEIEADIEIPTGSLDKVYKLLAKLRATPCVWEFNSECTNYETFLVYGFYKDFTIILQNPVISRCAITIEGLI